MDLRKVGIHPDFWQPVARSAEIRKAKMLPVSFAGEPIVLVRTEDGSLHALEDRCAHRQVPLHEGVVRGSRLQCGYHGWAYDMGGRCVDVPYLGRGGCAVNAVRRYPCREAYGLAFVFPGEPGKADRVPFPEVASRGDSLFKTRILDRAVACHYSFMHENLMDMNHQFLHRSLMGSIRAELLGYDAGKDWIEARYTFVRERGRQSWGEKFMIGGRDESAVGDRDTMTIRTGYPYQTLTFRRAGRKELALDLWLAYVPLDREQRKNRTLGLMMIRKPALPGLIHLLWPFIVRFTDGILEQDRRVVELEQRAHDDQGCDRNREVFPIILALREVLARSGAGQKTMTLPQ